MLTSRGRAVCAVLAVAGLAGWAGPAQPSVRPSSTARPAYSASPPAKRAVLLTGVSCAAADACLAVGSYYTSAAGPQLALAERWDGHGWQVQRTAGSALTGVSCTSDACVEISGGLRSVSCVSATWCQAVGDRSAARWTGQGWRPERVPVPAHRDVTLAGVSCAARFCLAVGDAQRPPGARPSPSDTDQALAELWDGTRWRMTRPIDPSRRTALSGVSCTSRFCLAVGATDAQYSLAERWNGARWQVQRTPDVNRIGYTVLNAVSCAAHACLAVGSYNGATLIAERWTGRGWALTRYGRIAGPPSVSCTATGCLVVASGAAPRWLRLRT